MRKKSQLTVRPLNAWNLSKLIPHAIQIDEKVQTQQIFKDGFPPHQGMFYEGKKSVLAAGLIDIGGGQYYLWTLFGRDFKPRHLRPCLACMNRYIKLLNCKSIHHIIRKDYNQSKRMMKLARFVYVRDENEYLEHWVRV